MTLMRVHVRHDLPVESDACDDYGKESEGIWS